MRHVGQGFMKPDNPGSLPWQEHVATIAGNAWKRRVDSEPLPPWAGPVALSGAFLFARPAGNTTAYPIGRDDAYDGDKLIRNVADALSAHSSRGAGRCKPACRKHGGVLADDRLIVKWGPFGVEWRDTWDSPDFTGGPGAWIWVGAL